MDFIRAKLQTLPDGKLICSQNGNRVKWYHSDGHTKTYIPKKNRASAEQPGEATIYPDFTILHPLNTELIEKTIEHYFE